MQKDAFLIIIIWNIGIYHYNSTCSIFRTYLFIAFADVCTLLLHLAWSRTAARRHGWVLT